MSEQAAELEELEGSDADFDAGFNGAPTETPELESEEKAPEPVAQEEQETKPEEPKYRQVTEDEFERLMAAAAKVDEINATVGKQFDTAFGKIGGMERVLKQFQDETPLGEAVEITEDDLAEIREEFPELVGPQLAALKRIASKMRGTGKAEELDEGRIQDLIRPSLSGIQSSAVETAKMEIANETLDETHAGWREVIGLPGEDGSIPETEYRKWLNQQPAEYRDRVLDSFSPVVIGRSIDKFQEHQESLKKKADSQRRDRFDQAVAPRGDGGHSPAPDDDDDFESGFNGR